MSVERNAVRRRNACGSFFQAVGRIAAAFLLFVAVVALPTAASAAPSLGVAIDFNWVNGVGFPTNTKITLSVNGGAKGTLVTTTDSGGNFGNSSPRLSWWSANVPNQQLLPGDTLKASAAGYPDVQMVIQDVAAIADRDGNHIFGTAKAPGPGGAPLPGNKVGASIYVDYSSPALASAEAITDSSGAFDIAFAYDLTLAHKVVYSFFSATDGTRTGHKTMREALNVIPLKASAQQNWIAGNGFPTGTEISISVNGGAKGTLPATTDLYGNFFLGWGDAGDQNHLFPGNTVTASFEGSTESMSIQNGFAVADLAADTVSGTAFTPGGRPLTGRRVRVHITDPGNWSELTSGEAWVDADGNFTVDLSPYDLVRGEMVQVWLWHDPCGATAGHSTYFEAYNAIPTLGVNSDFNWVYGQGFPANTDLTLSVNGDVKGMLQTTTDSNGYFGASWWDADVQNQRVMTGDTLAASNGVNPDVQMEVQEVGAKVDRAGDRVTGTAKSPGGAPLSGVAVSVDVFPSNGGWPPLASATGTTGLDGSFDILISDLDLTVEHQITVTLWSATDGSTSGHQTSRVAYNGIPELWAAVDRRWIRGYGFPANAELEVSLHAGADVKGTANVTTDSSGNFFKEWGEIGDGPSPGDTVTATYTTSGGGTVEMLVQNISVTVDIAGNNVFGTALDAITLEPLAGETVNLRITRSWNQNDPIAWLETTVSATTGEFEFNSGSWDIVRGDAIMVIHRSPEGHRTVRAPSAIDITGTVRKDPGSGSGMPGVSVRAYSEPMGDYIEASTDANGDYTLGGLPPGAYKLLFDTTAYNLLHPATIYQSEWHDNTSTFEAGDWIVISSTGAAQVVDAVLENTGGGIAGTVTGLGSQKLEGIHVCPQSESWAGGGVNCAAIAATGADGKYLITGLVPGSYKILFYTGEYNGSNGGTDYANLWTGSEIVTKGIVKTVNAQLVNGGAISGRVTREGEFPLPDIYVQFFTADGLWVGDAGTDGNGEYSQNLTPGTYMVYFDTGDYNEEHDADLVSAWYRKPDATSASLVTVNAGGTTEDIGAQLEAGGRISGWVGAPGVGSLLGIQVKVYAAGDGSTSVVETSTDANGQYMIRGVAPGSYKVYFDPALHNEFMSADYLSEWYHNKPYFGAATILQVGVGDRRTVRAWLIRPDAAKLFVISPLAGATWAQGSAQTIRWEGRVATGNVKLLLYDGGMNLKGTISASTPNNGVFNWIVPALQAPGTYQIYVVWISNPTVIAKSAFEVEATTGPIAVTPPGAPVQQGALKTITWSGIPQTGNVSIKLYLGTALKATVIASTPNDGSFDWAVPATLAPSLPGTSYTLKVTWLLKPTVVGVSDPFTVGETAGTFAVSKPAKGAEVRQGAVQEIAWSGIPQTGNVSIKLYLGTALKATVIASTPNDGSFDWTVPATLAPSLPGTSYTLKVTWLLKPTVIGTSDPFTVGATTGPITVSKPAKGAEVRQGAVQEIAWSGIPQTGNVSIKLYLGTALKATVIASTPNDGSFDWTVPAMLAYGDYTLLVTWLSKPAVFGTADFTVGETNGITPPFEVTAELPVGQGDMRTITWSGIPQTGNVSIKLYQGLVLKGTVIASTPNDGSFDWTVPATLPPMTLTPGLPTSVPYTLRVTWLSKPTVIGTSTSFNVVETISDDLNVKPLVAPVAQGAVQTITWGGIPPTGNVSIKLYLGTVLKATVIASTPNDGSFDWTVPATLAPNLPGTSYTLKVTWLLKPTVIGTSEEFSVSATNGPISVTQPGGTASVRQGAVQEIAWTGIPLTGNVKILLYQGTTLKATITASTPNSGSFAWVVPGTQALGADYTLRVVWLPKPTVIGNSAAPFTVIGP